MLDALHNLMTDPLISTFENSSRPKLYSLPEIFSALSQSADLEFAGLQPYQFHAWHAFLVQLGAIATHRMGHDDVRQIQDVSHWTVALRALTNGQDAPWCLIVPQLSAPAFMQPPVPEASLDRWDKNNATTTPDSIDLLETAKNHDLKMERIAVPHPEHWVFSLVSLQTMQGFSGRDNYGIARMNGGVSNRPGIAAARDLAWSTRFIRDANLLLEARLQIAATHHFDLENGYALLWLEPWNGLEQLTIDQLDPFFIEICRRLRLIIGNDHIIGRWMTSKVTRVAAKELKGYLGDPWVPVRTADSAAFTARDLGYKSVQQIIFDGEFRPSPASLPRTDDGDEPLLSCQVLVRGQGKTEGYHERLIPVPPKARLRFATADGRRRLGELSSRRLEEIKSVLSKVLKPAIAALLQGGPDKLDFRDSRLEPLTISFDQAVDGVFFAELFEDIDLPPEQARLKWLRQLLEFARETLERAKHSAPVPAARVFRAHAAADRVFYGAARRLRAAAGEEIDSQGETHGSPTA